MRQVYKIVMKVVLELGGEFVRYFLSAHNVAETFMLT